MQNPITWMSDNPFVAGATFFAIVVISLGMFLAYQMRAAGLSLKPLVFLAVFFAIIVVPQLVLHSLDWWLAKRAAAGDSAAPSAISANRQPGDYEIVYKMMTGGKVAPEFERDPRSVFPGIFAAAISARLAFTEAGESRLIAQFRDANSAQDALKNYMAFLQLQKVHGTDSIGWTTSRNGADFVHVASAGRLFMAWSGLTLQSVEQARSSIIPLPANFESLQGSDPASEKSGRPLTERLSQDWRLMLPLMLLLVCAAIGWFFKGSTWSATLAPKTGANILSLAELRDRLVRLHGSEKPFKVAVLADNLIQIEWDIADARWIDFANAHAVRAVHRLSLRLDELSRIVRVTEYWNGWEVSGGRGGVRGQWQAARGMKFFEKRVEKVYGLARSGGGEGSGAFSADLSLDLQALKAPVIDTVTGAGWTWRPMMWDGAPAWLHWLTE